MHSSFQRWAVLPSLWGPAERILHEHIPVVWWLVLHVFAVAARRRSSAWDGVTSVHSIRLLAIENVLFMHTRRRYRRLLWTLSPVFFQGQKPGLTDVQAELDRMTRKQDSMVSTNNVPPPTENEAWRQQKQLHHPLHKHSGRIHVHRKIDQIPNVYQSSHTVAPPKWVSDAIRHFGFLVRWKEDKWKC